jgi:hypothetical protein
MIESSPLLQQFLGEFPFASQDPSHFSEVELLGFLDPCVPTAKYLLHSGKLLRANEGRERILFYNPGAAGLPTSVFVEGLGRFAPDIGPNVFLILKNEPDVSCIPGSPILVPDFSANQFFGNPSGRFPLFCRQIKHEADHVNLLLRPGNEDDAV